VKGLGGLGELGNRVIEEVQNRTIGKRQISECDGFQLLNYPISQLLNGIYAFAAAARRRIDSASSNGFGKRRRIFQAMKLIDDSPGCAI
jgi:hypothetical protein